MKRGGARGCGRESDVEVKINALFVATRTCVLTDNVARMGLSGGVNPAPNRCSIWQIGQDGAFCIGAFSLVAPPPCSTPQIRISP